MKKIILSIFAVALTFASCTNDLNKMPLNENIYTSEKAYTDDVNTYLQGLAKIYTTYCQVGQGGPSGGADINVEDGGSSELIRMWWSLNEFSTDEVKCAWSNDSYVREMNFNTWTNSYNFAVFVVYNRFLLAVTLVNEYLNQTTDDKLNERGCSEATITQVHQFRDEARFVRAYMYWIGMDMFANIPFVTENDPVGGTFMPPQKTRTEIFDYVVSELNDLASSNSKLPAIKAATYPRIDKGAVYGLLSRVYLNAQIYTGTAHWQDAMNAAAEIINSGAYALATNYDDVFRGDNGDDNAVYDDSGNAVAGGNNARKEIIFGIDYNNNTQSFGGTRFLTCAPVGSDDLADYWSGADGGWGGIRVDYDYVQRFFPDVQSPNYTTGTFTCTDKRAKLFYIKGRAANIDNWAEFTQGWSLFKWHETPSSAKGNPATFGNTKSWSEVDFPLIRYGEILLNYAEASVRSGSADAIALRAYNDIRTRAGYRTTATSVTLDDIYMERTREMMWEGQRRVDLIRFGLYTSSTYKWPWKGGIATGQGFADYKSIFPIPIEDIAANSNLKQNPGY